MSGLVVLFLALFFAPYSFTDALRQGKSQLDRYACDAKIAPNYKVPDPAQCDRYAVCRDGNKTIELCKDGFGYNKKSGECLLLSLVDCSERPKLQEPKTRGNPDCRRANGDFPIRGVCDKYFTCVDDVSYQKDCPAGTVFDTVSSTCVHLSQAHRKDCQLNRILGNFTCPVIDIIDRDRGELKFGDHHRLPFPGGDCSRFVLCPQNREPIILSCPKPKVFDPVSGFCQLHVKGCEGFYKSEDGKKEDVALPVDPFEKDEGGYVEGSDELPENQEESDE